ncbi:MAG: MATE family efflux transporter [Verrucomicrobiota bacterium]|nr:MAG: MATE family efflux transporter [Verrucomicrobiota bacterium]
MRLTKYEPGSFAEIWTLAWPMVLAAMSNYLMSLVDRSFLGRYSTEAMVAATGAYTVYWTHVRTMMSFIAMATVIVSQCHGAHSYRQIGRIVWQVLYVAFGYYMVLIPCAIFSKDLLADAYSTLGAPYLSIILLTLPFHLAGYGAIGAFFLGIGRTRIVPVVMIISNVVNIVLDYLLILGHGGFPRLGIIGAGLAMGIAQMVAFSIFLYLFLRRPFRRYYHTHVPIFCWPLMKRLFSSGTPNAINSLFNAGGLALVFQIVGKVCSPDAIVAFSVAHTIHLAFWSFTDGLGKGVCTICSNYIGNGQMWRLRKIIRPLLTLMGIFGAVTAIFMVIAPQLVLPIFDIPNTSPEFFAVFRSVLFWAWVALVIDSVRWLTQNALISAGDALFTMFSNVGCFWGFSLLPISLMVYVYRCAGARFCWQCFATDAGIRIILNWLRFCSKRWRYHARRSFRVSRMDRQMRRRSRNARRASI